MPDPVAVIDTPTGGSPHQALVDLVAVEESWDGLVTVTVGAFGDLRDLRLDPRIIRNADAGVLAGDILRATRAAAAAVEEQAAGLAPRLLPGHRRHDDVDLAFDPVLHELDRRIAAPPPPADGDRPVIGGVDYERFRRRVVALRDQARELRESAESDDGLVTVTVGGHGELLDLALDPRVFRESHASELAATILSTVRRATARVGERYSAIFRSTT